MKHTWLYALLLFLVCADGFAQSQFQIQQQQRMEQQRRMEEQQRLEQQRRMQEQNRIEQQRRMEEMQRQREIQRQQQIAQQEQMRQQQRAQQEAMRQQQRIQQEQMRAQQQQQQMRQQQQQLADRQKQIQQSGSAAVVAQRQNIAASVLRSRTTVDTAIKQSGAQASARRQEILKSRNVQEAIGKARWIRQQVQDADARTRIDSARAAQARNTAAQQQRAQTQVRANNIRTEARRVEAKAQAERLRLVAKQREQSSRNAAQVEARRLTQSRAIAAMVEKKGRGNAGNRPPLTASVRKNLTEHSEKLKSRVAAKNNTSSRSPVATVQPSKQRIDYKGDFEADLENFNKGAVRRVERLEKDLILVQYHPDRALGDRRTAKWWTTTAEANQISSVAELRKRLALPPEWGDRSAVSVARIPKGTEIEYYVGTAKEQISRVDGAVFPGGGTQYRFRDFDPAWITETRTLP